MPERAIISKELANLFGALSHPHRVRIIEELRDGECDVQTLQDLLASSQSAVSQHLAILRSHRIVEERREGRHVYYRLRQPGLASWVMVGLRFLEADRLAFQEFEAAAEKVRKLWPDAEPAIHSLAHNGTHSEK